MGIQRYSASMDTTITNAYKMNLTTRATGSNMGLADTLETFSIYAQANTASSELSRILVQFPVNNIAADRTAGTIPNSGSVSFFLRMYNAEHSSTVPKDFTLNVAAVSSSWEEGYGLDMDEYTDLTYDDVGANWIMAASGSAAATATITITDAGGPTGEETFTIVNSAGTTTTFTINGGGAYGTQSEEAAGGTVTVNIGGAGGGSAGKTNVAAAINAKINALTGDPDYSSTTDGVDTVTVTQTSKGLAGNQTNADSVTGITVGSFTGGAGNWAAAGGDYYTDTSSSFTASFSDGTENIELDISPLVEQWLSASTLILPTDDANLGSKTNYGVGIKYFDAQEGETRSYYTKKFFARGSQYYLKRPTLEARWDSTIKDDSGVVYLSSSLATAAQNLNTIYMYNNIRGQLTNIPSRGTGIIRVSIYSGNLANTAPDGDKLFLPVASPNVLAERDTEITGGYAGKTGLYSASFAYASSSITTIFPVWHYGTDTGVDEFNTGSAITVKTFDAADYNPHPSYVSKITNLRDSYSRDEKMTRFRLYVREKDWNPNIYTKASSDISTSIVDDAYYRIYRTVDEFQVVAYGTGSANHTRLSYDASGSYFDFPVDILEAGYMYAFKFLYKMPDGNYREQPEIFKFRVE